MFVRPASERRAFHNIHGEAHLSYYWAGSVEVRNGCAARVHKCRRLCWARQLSVDLLDHNPWIQSRSDHHQDRCGYEENTEIEAEPETTGPISEHQCPQHIHYVG